MAAAFKDELGPAPATALAGELSRAWPSFPRECFMDGLPAALECARRWLPSGDRARWVVRR
jgi:hypothetical protein